MPKPKSKKPKSSNSGAGAGGGSVLERLIGLLGKPGIIVTATTTWAKLGFTSGSLDDFCRVQVANEFGKPFDGSDAGKTVGVLAGVITTAIGA